MIGELVCLGLGLLEAHRIRDNETGIRAFTSRCTTVAQYIYLLKRDALRESDAILPFMSSCRKVARDVIILSLSYLVTLY